MLIQEAWAELSPQAEGSLAGPEPDGVRDAEIDKAGVSEGAHIFRVSSADSPTIAEALRGEAREE